MTLYRHRASGPGSAGDTWTTTMHSSGAASLGVVQGAWTTLVSSFVNGTLGPMWPNEFSITECVTDMLDANTGKNTAQARNAVNLPGTGAGGTPSPRTALVISLRTSLPTRQGRGRQFWLAPDATHFTATGLLNGTDATAIANGYGAALTAFRTTSSPCIRHALPKTPVTFDLVTYIAVSTVFGSQRRRTNRVFTSYATKTI